MIFPLKAALELKMGSIWIKKLKSSRQELLLTIAMLTQIKDMKRN
jgi:hypothetical protein